MADSMFPINARGTKRIMSRSDIGGHNPAGCFPKFDGVPGVVMIEGSTMVFMGSTVRFSKNLTRVLSIPVVLTGELVDVRTGGSVVIVTGVVSVCGTVSDPLDYEALRPLVPQLERLAPDGIIPTVPELSRLVVGDEVVLGASGRQPVRLPVDGIMVTVAGRNGVFVKPTAKNTVDMLPEEAGVLMDAAYSMASGSLKPRVRLSTEPGVSEYTRVEGTEEWRPVRTRPDKRGSDQLGAVVQTLFSVDAAYTLRVSGTVQNLFRVLTTQ